MRKQDWEKELASLVQEVCSQEGTLYQRKPEAGRDDMGNAAWEKVEQVYGKGCLDHFGGAPKERVLQRLVDNPRVNRLLTPPAGEDFHTLKIKEGSIERGSPLAGQLACGGRLERAHMEGKQQWAKAFRNKINGFVYRTGDGHEPQMWPLIRRVVLLGPWPVLSSGACLVDLPGVKDSNAARANVAASYLQQCSCIWIVAPIKRAVDVSAVPHPATPPPSPPTLAIEPYPAPAADARSLVVLSPQDGTAKDLLGEQFKRRLLMDGQYGNVSFVCTQVALTLPSLTGPGPTSGP